MTTRLTRSLFIPLLLLAAGCGGQVGEEQVVCEPIRREPLTLDQVSPLGFTGQDLLDAAGGRVDADVIWADNTATTMTIDVAYAGALEFQDREWQGDGSLAEIGPGDCDDVLQIGLRVDVSTADGALAESWEVNALADTADAIVFSRDLDAVQGSLSIEQFAPDTDWDSVRGWIDLTVGVEPPSGRIDGQAQSEQDGGTASAEFFEIATIGEPEETP